jgi:anaerobic selenocysteine-containing dehydrogenase
VRRVLEAVAGATVARYEDVQAMLGRGEVGALVLTGNYPDAWADESLLTAVGRARVSRPFVVLIDTLSSALVDEADIVLPGATFAEKAGTFENARGMIQAFEAAIPVIELAKPEGQIASDLLAVARGIEGRPAFPETVETPAIGMEIPATVEVAPPRGRLFNPAQVRAEMAGMFPGLAAFGAVRMPELGGEQGVDMRVVEL